MCKLLECLEECGISLSAILFPGDMQLENIVTFPIFWQGGKRANSLRKTTKRQQPSNPTVTITALLRLAHFIITFRLQTNFYTQWRHLFPKETQLETTYSYHTIELAKTWALQLSIETLCLELSRWRDSTWRFCKFMVGFAQFVMFGHQSFPPHRCLQYPLLGSRYGCLSQTNTCLCQEFILLDLPRTTRSLSADWHTGRQLFTIASKWDDNPLRTIMHIFYSACENRKPRCVGEWQS